MEDLDEPIYFRNADWAVTGYGIERTDGSYPIEAKRLGELANYTDQKLPDWPLHIARKVWNFDLFMEAFMIALGSVRAATQRTCRSLTPSDRIRCSVSRSGRTRSARPPAYEQHFGFVKDGSFIHLAQIGPDSAYPLAHHLWWRAGELVS